MKLFIRKVDSVTKFTWVENGDVKTVKRKKKHYFLDWASRFNPEVGDGIAIEAATPSVALLQQ